MADEIGVAADRRREVAVRRAGEPGVPEIRGVVAGLLQRPEDERRECGCPAAGAAHVVHHALGDLPGQRRGLRGRHALRFGRRRRRHAEIGEHRDQPRDRLRLGRVVDAVERLAAAAAQQPGDGLVGEDHELLDEHVGVRLALEPRVGDPSLAVEGERGLGRFYAERTSREPPSAQLLGQALGVAERLFDLLRKLLPSGQRVLGEPVREPRIAPDHRAVEHRRPHLEAGAERDLDRQREAVEVRSEAAQSRRRAPRAASARRDRGRIRSTSDPPRRRRVGSRRRRSGRRPRCGRTRAARRPRGRRRSRRRSPSPSRDRS